MDPRLEGEFIAVVNAGSSSIKLSMFSLHEDRSRGPLRLELRAQVEGLGTTPHFEARHADGSPAGSRDWPVGEGLSHEGALDHLVEFVRHEFPRLEMLGIGHRVVHGGTGFDAPIVVTPEVLRQLEALIPLAPLHQPHNLAPVRRAFSALPGLPQVACFDTAFHRGQPPLAQMFALPRRFHEAGVQRYGFHGLSYEFVTGRLAELDPDLAGKRLVVAHLGNGASLCAVHGGKSHATTMGFTAVDG
ncbi:MAG: acetate kinase, partial [Mitsuaria chitosanitabida]|nr:acetate kinase [Roseateles chitosanitabidus]